MFKHTPLEPITVAALAAGVTFLICGPVFAQTAVTVAKEGVDFAPLANNVIAAAVAVLTVAAGVVSKFAVSFMASKTKLSDTAFEKLMADRVNDILLRAIDHGEMRMKELVADPDSPVHSVRVDNMFLRIAVEYAQRSMPDLIAYFKLTPDRIADMIKARLNSFVTPPAQDSGKISIGS